MAYETIQRVSVPNLKLFERPKTEFWVKEAEELSIMLYGKMGGWADGHSTWLTQYKCMEIFLTLNSPKACIYRYIDLKLAKVFQNQVIYTV